MSLVGTAAATARSEVPVPTASPPPQCFVMKGGQLPLCEQRPDGTWDVIYSPGAKSSGQSNTKRDIEIVIAVLALVGIGVIVWRQWMSPNRSSAVPPTAPFEPRTVAADWNNAYLPPTQPAPAATTQAATTPAATPPTEQPPAAPPAPPSVPPGAAQQLLELNSLFNSGQITREDYDARRNAILGGS